MLEIRRLPCQMQTEQWPLLPAQATAAVPVSLTLSSPDTYVIKAGTPASPTLPKEWKGKATPVELFTGEDPEV